MAYYLVHEPDSRRVSVSAAVFRQRRNGGLRLKEKRSAFHDAHQTKPKAFPIIAAIAAGNRGRL